MKKTRKEKILRIVAEKGLYSIMNNTKWNELKNGVLELQLYPPYVMKCVDEEETHCHQFDKDPKYEEKEVWHAGTWGDGYKGCLDWDCFATPFYAIEWIKVRPRYIKHQRCLMPEVIAQDMTEDFLTILTKHNIPFEEEDGAFIIYGYRSV